jgi:hypothetical protein
VVKGLDPRLSEANRGRQGSSGEGRKPNIRTLRREALGDLARQVRELNEGKRKAAAIIVDDDLSRAIDQDGVVVGKPGRHALDPEFVAYARVYRDAILPWIRLTLKTHSHLQKRKIAPSIDELCRLIGDVRSRAPKTGSAGVEVPSAIRKIHDEIAPPKPGGRRGILVAPAIPKLPTGRNLLWLVFAAFDVLRDDPDLSRVGPGLAERVTDAIIRREFDRDLQKKNPFTWPMNTFGLRRRGREPLRRLLRPIEKRRG